MAIVMALPQLLIGIIAAPSRLASFSAVWKVASVIQLTLLFTGMALCFQFLSLDMYRMNACRKV
uniref:Uncharacterized protein n=1 Tax=Oryza barthii TaxID=65489 RepID=A0A0D3GLD5_9ORYZ